MYGHVVARFGMPCIAVFPCLSPAAQGYSNFDQHIQSLLSNLTTHSLGSCAVISHIFELFGLPQRCAFAQWMRRWSNFTERMWRSLCLYHNAKWITWQIPIDPLGAVEWVKRPELVGFWSDPNNVCIWLYLHGIYVHTYQRIHKVLQHICTSFPKVLKTLELAGSFLKLLDRLSVLITNWKTEDVTHVQRIFANANLHRPIPNVIRINLWKASLSGRDSLFFILIRWGFGWLALRFRPLVRLRATRNRRWAKIYGDVYIRQLYKGILYIKHLPGNRLRLGTS